MRGSDARSGSLFSYVDLEDRVPAKHPLRVIKVLVDEALVSLDADFERLYEGTGRQSIAPERLSAVAYADTRPIRPNVDDEARARNRRVEFLLSKPPPPTPAGIPEVIPDSITPHLPAPAVR